MPDTKISALPTKAEMLLADYLTIISGGANYKLTRESMLTAHSGEDMILRGGTAAKIRMRDDSLTGILDLLDGGDLQFTGNSYSSHVGPSNLGKIDQPSDGSVLVQACSGKQVLLQEASGTVTVTLDGTTNRVQIHATAGVGIDYIPTTPTDWNGTPPSDLPSAVDRCATLLKALNGGTGP